jgi:hydrogenase maturation protein HypF
MNVDPLVRAAWRDALNCPLTSAVGRLFDAAAALVLNVHDTSYEGQGPMMLEAAAAQIGDHLPQCAALPMYREASGLWRLDWGPLIADLLDSQDAEGVRATRFHGTLAASIVAVAEEQRSLNGVNIVGLTGGVFQNALLTSQAHRLLIHQGFRVRLAERVPCNDGGLSYGQLIEFASRQRRHSAN